MRMDKSCQTCANYTDTCRKCVTSGTFSGWEARTNELISNRMCVTCKHSEVERDKEPCKTCIDSGNERSMWEPEPEPKPDNVNHPAHYTTGCGFECIEMMEMVFGKEAVHDFCTLNAFKYIWRHRQKGGTEDIAKAEWYLKYACKLTEGGLRRHLTAINKMTDHIEKLKGEATK